MVVCRLEGCTVLVDGFRRLRAARILGGFERLGLLLDCSARMNGWLRREGRAQLQACDREPLVESFTKLGEEACLLAEGTRDFLQELRLP